MVSTIVNGKLAMGALPPLERNKARDDEERQKGESDSKRNVRLPPPRARSGGETDDRTDDERDRGKWDPKKALYIRRWATVTDCPRTSGFAGQTSPHKVGVLRRPGTP